MYECVGVSAVGSGNENESVNGAGSDVNDVVGEETGNRQVGKGWNVLAYRQQRNVRRKQRCGDGGDESILNAEGG